MLNESRTDVVIAGAGPIGLSMAIHLKSQGFSKFRIFDHLEEPGEELITSVSRAIGVHARTLEILEDVGVTPALLERGKIAMTASNYYNSKLSYRVDYPSGCDDAHVKYNWNLMVTQGNTIDVLHQHLRDKLQHNVEWNKEIGDFEQDADGVTVKAVCKNTGLVETIRAKYLLGCDGCHSQVRKGLGIGFPGKAYPVKWVVCDLDIDWDVPHDDITFISVKDAYAIALPLAGGGESRFRVTMGMPLTKEEMKAETGHASPLESRPFTKEDCVAFFKKIYPKATVQSTPAEPQPWFKVHCRFADTFHKDRCFLVGDAGHVHSPILGQGMNMGIQDGANLAWKVAAVCRGDSHEKLLDTYKQEREHADRKVVHFVHRITRLVITPSRFIQKIRGRIISRLLRKVKSRRKIVSKVMQLSINYRSCDSPLIKDQWNPRGKGIPAGCRVPDPVYLKHQDRSYQLFETIRGNRWNALVFAGKHASKEAYDKACDVANEIQENYGGLVSAHVVVPSGFHWDNASPPNRIVDRTGILHETFGVSKPSMYLCRPDRYVGFREEGYTSYSTYLQNIYPAHLVTGELVYG